MNCQAFTNDSLTMMYEAIRGALAADEALKRQGLAIRFRVRETPDWKKHAADLESDSSAECVSRSSIGQKIGPPVEPSASVRTFGGRAHQKNCQDDGQFFRVK